MLSSNNTVKKEKSKKNKDVEYNFLKNMYVLFYIFIIRFVNDVIYNANF